MIARRLDIVVLGLSITSSWGNGHATTYRGLLSALAERGHRVLFLERDVPWYAGNRDLPQPPYGETALYASLDELFDRFARRVRAADLVIVGSFVPDGVAVIQWVQATARGFTAFYDIDTPETLAALDRGHCAYLDRAAIPRFHLYLSFTGGSTLARLQRDFGAACARVLYCSFDPVRYFPEPQTPRWDLGYMGTFSADRQAALRRLLIEPAQQTPHRRFVVAGPMYPPDVNFPDNVARVDHVPPSAHRSFYCQQRFTLNVTRAAMVRAGYSPSVRLFEAAACAVPIISDAWPGLDTLFVPGREILIAGSPDDTRHALESLDPDDARRIGERARLRVLAQHTAAHRAATLETYVADLPTSRDKHFRVNWND